MKEHYRDYTLEKITQALRAENPALSDEEITPKALTVYRDLRQMNDHSRYSDRKFMAHTLLVGSERDDDTPKLVRQTERLIHENWG